jgi:heme-degrading monooxygenase HmoA
MASTELGRVVEHAILPVKPGRETEFEAAFAEAKSIIARIRPGV